MTPEAIEAVRAIAERHGWQLLRFCAGPTKRLSRIELRPDDLEQGRPHAE